MTAQAHLDDAQRLCLSGTLEFANLEGVKTEAEHFVTAATTDIVECDCTQLEVANSLCVALFIALLRTANQAGKRIAFTGISAKLRGVVEFSGVAGVIFDNA